MAAFPIIFDLTSPSPVNFDSVVELHRLEVLVGAAGMFYLYDPRFPLHRQSRYWHARRQLFCDARRALWNGGHEMDVTYTLRHVGQPA